MGPGDLIRGRKRRPVTLGFLYIFFFPNLLSNLILLLSNLILLLIPITISSIMDNHAITQADNHATTELQMDNHTNIQADNHSVTESQMDNHKNIQADNHSITESQMDNHKTTQTDDNANTHISPAIAKRESDPAEFLILVKSLYNHLQDYKNQVQGLHDCFLELHDILDTRVHVKSEYGLRCLPFVLSFRSANSSVGRPHG